ncbi:MAG: hypothetical protein HY318_02960 [Armatimonadetes bacterium]|nr:hypothetical protein [Armatimonadota bacterium]
MCDREVRQNQIKVICNLSKVAAERGIDVWLTGGWAIELQTDVSPRGHHDVDFAVRQEHLERFHSLLEECGSIEDDSNDCNRDRRRRYMHGSVTVETAAVRFDSDRIYMSVPPNGSWLPCPVAELGAENCCNLTGASIRCAGKGLLLRSKYSGPPDGKGAKDIASLEQRLTPAEIGSAKDDARTLGHCPIGPTVNPCLRALFHS